MITSDAHEGMLRAIKQEFPDVPWQRCQFHFSRNILDKSPKKYQAGLATELNEMFNCETVELARRKRDQILADYRDVAETAMGCLENGFESCMTVMNLPKGMRRYYRTSNHIERVNKELKRRSKVIGIFPNEASLVRLMGSVLIEENARNLSSRKIFSKESYAELLKSDVKNKLVVIAKEQEALLAV